MREHRRQLLARKEQLDLLIKNMDKSLAALEGRMTITDQEKFEGFKRELIEENEQKFGAEARAKYGDAAVDRSNEMLMGMTKEQYDRFVQLGEELMQTLKAAFATGDPAGELAQKAADMHRQWLAFTWPPYSKEAHAGLAQMYVDDERFTAYYDQDQPGLAKFLRDAILIYTGMAN